MYKIFINEKPFIITTKDVEEPRFSKCKRVQHDPSKTLTYIKECESMKSKGLVILTDDEVYAFKDCYTHFVTIQASGGVVFNEKNEILLIKRMGKWDLPKGKIDGEETAGEAAIREVMEECGIKDLQLQEPLPDTFHTYKLHNHRFLKITHWFRMKTSSDQKLTPQKEELISEVKWVDWKTLDVQELDTYYSIKDLLLEVR